MKDNFDDILKKKWEEFHFPVDEQHRQDMIRLLDDNNRRRTGIVWWLGGITLAITVVAVVIFGFTKNQINESSTPMQPEIKALEEKTLAENGSLKNLEEIKPAESNATDNTLAPQEAANSNSLDLSNSKNEYLPKSTTTKSTTAIVKESPVQADESGEKDRSNKPQSTEVQFNDVVNENTSDLNKEQNSIESPSLEEENNTVDPLTPTVANTSLVGSEPVVNRVTIITASIDDLEFGILDFKRNEWNKVEPVFVKQHPIALFAEAGMGYVPSFHNQYSAGWSLKAGGGIDYALSDKNHISLSGGYQLQKGGFDFERSSTVQQNSFGVRSSFNTLTPDKLHFVYSRLGFHHRTHRHIFSVFGGVQYLYGAQGEIVVVTNDPISGDTVTSKKAWLKLDGMRRWLFNTEIQYGYMITPRLSLQAGVKYNFTPLEETDPELQQRGFLWNGKLAAVSPFLTVNYQIYEK